MPRHEIEPYEVQAWLNKPIRIELAASYGFGSAKKIEAVLETVWSSDPQFVVTDHDAVVFSGTDLTEAVDFYNSRD